MLCKKYLMYRNRQVKYYNDARGFKLITVVLERIKRGDKNPCKTCTLYGRCLAYTLLTKHGATISIHSMCNKVNYKHKYYYKIYLC